ncbi:MAG: SNF2 helicase associated domain-containing protein, partial [Erysipelotrichaceae bacterium]|nr:SNF2 helicase associated domain-containing protein [Erysipelotrichaceae bacterium]
MKLRENEIRNVVSSYRNYSLTKRYAQMDVIDDMWITLDDNLNYVVKASLRVYNKIEKCEMLISPEGRVLNYGCECIWCDRMSACAHIGAVMMLIDEVQPEHFPYHYQEEKQKIQEELERKIALMERRRKRDSARQATRVFMSDVVDNFVRETDAQLNLTKYRIYAEMNIDRYRGCTLTFKVGAEKLYVIKNISEFLVHISSKDKVKYGKTCEFVHAMDAFDEASCEIIRFFRTLKEMGGYSYYGLQREVHISNEILDLVYETFSQMDLQHCGFTCTESAFYPELYCEKDEDEIIVTLESENFYCGNNALYRLDAAKNQLIQKEGENPNVLLNLMKALKKNGQIVLEKKDVLDFYRYVYEEVKEEVLWQGYQFDDLAELEANRVLYGDVDSRGKIYFILECVYEDGTRKYALDNTPYSLTTERIVRALITYGEEVDPDKGIVYFDETAEKTYTFLKEVLPVIQNECDVYVSTALRNMGTSRSYGITVGIGVEHNLLELNVYSNEIPASELMDVLKAYRRKRKFHRLKNGQLLSLESEELAELDHVMEQYNVSTSQFKDGAAQMNLYRAVALNRTADETKHVVMRRSEKFCELIERFKNAAQTSIELPERYESILRDYQKTGIQWMNTLGTLGFGGILADDMGL